MRLPSIARLSLVILGVAAIGLTSGCSRKKAKTQDPYSEGDTLNSGEVSETWENGDNPLPGGRFESLPRVQGVNFSPVYFGYNNYQIDGSEYGKIDAVADFMRSNPNVVLVVEGHCDERGTIEYNMSLGDYRAQSVRSYMISAGIEADRIQTQSYGKERPAVQGSGEAVWSRNRRGEFALYQK